jgi:hypothetical protein
MSYLFQRLETDGDLAILTTNIKTVIDTAL